MPEIAIGLPNQALKPLVSTFVSDVKPTVPFEQTGSVTGLAAATETDIPLVPAGSATVTVGANKKVIIDSLKVKASNIDTIFRLYRGSQVVAVFQGDIANKTYEVFELGVGKEYDEGQTLKVTAESTAGGGNAWATLSGREELKRDTVFSPVLA